ncbi:universal stress protein [Yinghuangia aomiensis]
MLAVHVRQLPMAAATQAGPGRRAAGGCPRDDGASARRLDRGISRGARPPRDRKFGHPVQVLAAESKGTLCLVVGTRGLGGFRGMLLGSVSSGYSSTTPACPLVAAPAPSTASDPVQSRAVRRLPSARGAARDLGGERGQHQKQAGPASPARPACERASTRRVLPRGDAGWSGRCCG